MSLVDFGFMHEGIYYVVIAHEALLCRCQYYDTDWALERTAIFNTRDVLKWVNEGYVSLEYEQ